METSTLAQKNKRHGINHLMGTEAKKLRRCWREIYDRTYFKFNIFLSKKTSTHLF